MRLLFLSDNKRKKHWEENGLNVRKFTYLSPFKLSVSCKILRQKDDSFHGVDNYWEFNIGGAAQHVLHCCIVQ